MERSIWTDALLFVITLGFYMPYWLYERNKRLREANPSLDLSDNLGWIIGGLVLTFGAAWLAFGDPYFAAAGQIVAVAVFSVGVHLLAANGERAADATGRAWEIPPPFVTGTFGAAFALMQVANMMESAYAAGLSALLLVGVGYMFYRMWHDLDVLLPHAPASAPPTS